MRKLTQREAVARALPTYDRAMADRLIAWLNECGYQIVEKDGVTLAPPEPADDKRQRAQEYH
jgi:hypothetical protein